MRRMLVATGAVLTALLAVTPVAAAETVRWTDTHDIDNTFTCGVVEHTGATIEGTAYFAAGGTWVKDILRFSFDASFTDPASGETISYKTRQVVIATPETVSFQGQGIFIRVPVAGAVLLDVGRLVIDPSDGSTVFKSVNALAFDDPTIFDRYDAAICGLF